MGTGWIKFGLHPGHPKVVRIALLTGDNVFSVLGRCATWFRWIDEHCDGPETGLTESDFTRLLKLRNRRFPHVSWLLALQDPLINWVTVINKEVEEGPYPLVASTKRLVKISKQIRVVNYKQWFNGSSKHRSSKTKDLQRVAQELPAGAGTRARKTDKTRLDKTTTINKDVVVVFSQEELKFMEQLQASGVSQEASQEVVAEVKPSAEQIRVALHNAEILRSRGKLHNGPGYILDALRSGYGELAKAKDAVRSEAERQRGDEERAKRQAQEKVAEIQAAETKMRIDAMSTVQRHELLNKTLETMPPFLRDVTTVRTFENPMLRAFARKLMDKTRAGEEVFA